ncbi:S1 RNA-binding domain-containing protein [Kitasatospora sp. NPDC002040]|uniref:S1 RNA-binding domain-containing protein n=1 Tax=Kitasatospora sp. NPDC002040 TaxID=3154661 RepID=UPI00332BA721
MVAQAVTGHVTKLAPIGMFVRIAVCVAGLAPLTELSNPPVEHPEKAIHEEQQISVSILAVAIERHRISLSAKPVP